MSALLPRRTELFIESYAIVKQPESFWSFKLLLCLFISSNTLNQELRRSLSISNIAFFEDLVVREDSLVFKKVTANDC